MRADQYENFGSATFDKKMMKERLPYPVYQKWKNATRKEEALDRETADAIAHAMKTWAIERGATHYCHWFQPLNGVTAKKHDSFLDRTAKNEAIVRFSGSELIKSEPDASSFPSGGMRSTFEARGYTYWDCTANTFIIDNIMYIPSIFISYTGEVLDKKGPLLKSMDYISLHANRLSNLFSETHSYRCRSKVGLEQEFFLVDKGVYEKRQDLVSTGKTLFGARPPKSGNLTDHYLGSFPKRVNEFYKDVNNRLWALGIYAKTEHNEAAPNQFELAVLYETANIAVDDNLVVMETLKKCAQDWDLVCLLEEKPFSHINGSGKHNNWSLETNYGENLFDPGESPQENTRFILFVAAVVKAVDEYSDLIRFSSSSPGNDDRLGGDEAPPPIISIYLGENIESSLYKFAGLSYSGDLKPSNVSIDSIRDLPVDYADRNRTSPVSFTGNKFEFRLLGASRSASDINIAINASVGSVLKEMADRLEAEGEKDRERAAKNLVKEVLIDHKRILYSGDGYSEEWIEEAKRRGLHNISKHKDAIKVLKEDRVIELYSDANIYSKKEIGAIYNVNLDELIRVRKLEIQVLIRMLDQEIIPSVSSEIKDLGETLKYVENEGVEKRLRALNDKLGLMIKETASFEEELLKIEGLEKKEEKADRLEELKDRSKDIRKLVDGVEQKISKKNWKMPSYEEIFNAI